MNQVKQFATDCGASLTVKELAGELGVSDKYVKLMHAAGFAMEWRKLPGCGERKFLTATLPEARLWIEVNEFRLVHCRPVLTIGQMRFGFPLGKWTGFKNVVKTLDRQIAA